jgi:hypothetical protein
MSKVKLKKEHQAKFMSLGFAMSNDPEFPWEKSIVSAEVIEEMGLREDEVPKLLYGSTGINKGFCIFVPEHFIWINSSTPEEAIEFANQIVAFEPQ